MLFLAAIFAPAICSNHPLVVHDEGEWHVPWFRALFHADEPIDLVFNMGLLTFFPALACVLCSIALGAASTGAVSPAAAIASGCTACS